MQDDDEVLTLEEVSNWLKLPQSSVYRLTASKSIPHKKLGRRLRFSRRAVSAWLDAQNVEIAQPEPSDAPAVNETRQNRRSRAPESISRDFVADSTHSLNSQPHVKISTQRVNGSVTE
jgi:excisionase family DNA binding protein